MTVLIHIGRRVPRNWYKRTASKVKGLITFQENIWHIINQSLSLSKRKAVADGRMKFIITRETENEDIHYMIEWRKITIQGTPEMEEDEYNDALKLYDKIRKKFKKDYDVDERLSKHFNSKILNSIKVDEAYKKGFGVLEHNNIAQKLLEMGILTHIDWDKDFESRETAYY